MKRIRTLTRSVPRMPGLACALAVLGTALVFHAAAQPVLEAPFTQITTGPVVAGSSMWTSAAWGDYDNDGWLDWFVTVFHPVSTPPSGIKNRLYHNQGDGSFVRINQGSLVTDGTNAGGCAWGDYDNDGFLDVFVPFGTIFSPQRNSLYRNLGDFSLTVKGPRQRLERLVCIRYVS
jgi:hypothetical protein